MKKLINEELIYAAGGCWILERQYENESGELIWYRIDDTFFFAGDVPINDVFDGKDYVEMFSLDLTDDFTPDDAMSLLKADCLDIFHAMADAYAKADKTLKVKTFTEGDMERARVKLLMEYIDSHDPLFDDVDKWSDLDWTIGFNGMTITIKNCAAVYNAIKDMAKEYEA